MTPERAAELLAGHPEGTRIVHVTPAIDETCDHEWGGGGRNGPPEACVKCGLSFTRYIHCCLP